MEAREEVFVGGRRSMVEVKGGSLHLHFANACSNTEHIMQ